ncbi:hypothetical protein Taro_000974 [Colocasia esculenta]|uniref:Uncharacterized protein n=1 Tax=Colocasia esculenta TaxID=4460 RepID=A0A843T9J4_COLES|nr:hypothetical protein [Colocasia esculenta]
MKTGLSVSTQPLVVSTLVPDSRRPSCQTGTVCRHSYVSTHSVTVSTHPG